MRCDNGTALLSQSILLDFSQPGKPTHNAFIESFDRRVRREVLNSSYFETIEARSAARVWRAEYNEFRPHSMLANKTPKEFAAARQNQLRSRSSNARAGLTTG
jgi:putative transposase